MGFRNRASSSESTSPQESESLIDIPYSDTRQERGYFSRRHSQGVRIVLFNDGKKEIPQTLCAEILKSKYPATVKRNWDSVMADLLGCDLIIDWSDNIDGALRRIDEVSRRKVKERHAIRPSYLVVSTVSRYPLARFEVEFRRGRIFYFSMMYQPISVANWSRFVCGGAISNAHRPRGSLSTKAAVEPCK